MFQLIVQRFPLQFRAQLYNYGFDSREERDAWAAALDENWIYAYAEDGNEWKHGNPQDGTVHEDIDAMFEHLDTVTGVTDVPPLEPDDRW